jgi:hypothetical protein
MFSYHAHRSVSAGDASGRGLRLALQRQRPLWGSACLGISAGNKRLSANMNIHAMNFLAANVRIMMRHPTRIHEDSEELSDNGRYMHQAFDTGVCGQNRQTHVICRRRPAGSGHVPQPYVSAVTTVPAVAASFVPAFASTVIPAVAAKTTAEEVSILATGSDENFACRLPPAAIGVQDTSDIWDPAATSGDFGFKEPPISDPEQTGFSVHSQAALVDLGGLGGHAPAVTMFPAGAATFLPAIATTIIQTVAATTNAEEASILATGSDENFARRLPPTDIGVQDSSDIWDPAATSGDFDFKKPPLSDPEQTKVALPEGRPTARPLGCQAAVVVSRHAGGRATGVRNTSDVWDSVATSGDFGFKEPPLNGRASEMTVIDNHESNEPVDLKDLASRSSQSSAPPIPRREQVRYVLKLLDAKGEQSAPQLRRHVAEGKGITVKGTFFDANVLREALQQWTGSFTFVCVRVLTFASSMSCGLASAWCWSIVFLNTAWPLVACTPWVEHSEQCSYAMQNLFVAAHACHPQSLSRCSVIDQQLLLAVI